MAKQVTTTVGTISPTPTVESGSTTLGTATEIAPSSQQITTNTEMTEEVTERVVAPVTDGIKKGTVRSVTVDATNTQNFSTIQKAATSVQQTTISASSSTATDATASSSTQRVEQLQSQTFVSQKSKQDVVRALQKLQRTCNHSYSLVTSRCNFCNKLRSSHYYD